MSDSLTPFEPRHVPSPVPPLQRVTREGPAPRFGTQGAADDEVGSVPWSRYFSAIRRSWWIVLLVGAAGSAVGFELARRQPVTYVAETQVLINPSATQPGAPIGARVLWRSNQWVPLLQSSPVADSVVTRLQLHVSFAGADDLREYFVLSDDFAPGQYRLQVDSSGQEYTLVHLNSGETETGVVGDSIGRRWGFQWAPPTSLLPPTRTVEFSLRTVRESSQGILGRIVARMPSEDAQFIQLWFRDADPQRAAMILNTWTDRLIEAAEDIKRRGVVESRTIVAEQLSLAQQELGRAETQLKVFGEKTAGMPGRGADGGMGNTVIEERMQLEDLRRDLARLEGILQRAGGNPIPPQDFWAVPDALASMPRLQNAIDELEQLKGRRTAESAVLGPEHPTIDSLNSGIRRLEVDLIPRYTRDLIERYRIQEADIGRRVASRTQELRGIPALTIEEAQLQRQVRSYENLYEGLKRRAEELRMTDAQTAADLVRLGSADVPTRPERNEAARLLLMAIVASLGAGLALALLRDRVDRRLRYPEQATMELGLTIAGTVPRLRFNRKKELGVTALSQVVESFRALRLTVRHQFPNGEPVVLCVSSPGASEGKSLVSSNLAVAFANAGHSTLLIDGDVRRGVVHSTFDAPRRPGLVDHLGGRVTADAVIRATSTPNLSIIPSGTRTKNAPEMLVSDAMAALVAAMRERFEVVIIDSAPFAAGMDAFALGAAAGTMLVVLRPGVTDRKLAAMKLEVLDRLPVGVVGAVLNGIAHGSAYKYYYADYGYADAREWALDDDVSNQDPALVGDVSGPRLIGKP